MEHSAKADFHGGLGRKGSWRAPFVFLAEYHQILIHKRIKNRVFCLVNGVHPVVLRTTGNSTFFQVQRT